MKGLFLILQSLYKRKANVGDTTTAMIKHTNAKILCVEPIKKIYKLLIKNINKFVELYNKRITLANVSIVVDDTAEYISVTMGCYG